MKALIMTNEYPPFVYGGAGVHVDYLSKNLARFEDVEVRSFKGRARSEGRLVVREGYATDKDEFRDANEAHVKLLSALKTCVNMAAAEVDADVVHCHTWYTFFAGFTAKKLYSKPLVVTMHSLEPLRPWKAQQLGTGGYEMSLWAERTGVQAADTVIAVSKSMKSDVVECYGIPEEKVDVIYNGIDVDEFRHTDSRMAIEKYKIPGPYVLFVGRITEQKGIRYLIEAVDGIDDGTYVVICAGPADTKELSDWLHKAVKNNRRIVLIEEMVGKDELIELYSNAQAFVCPSVYEPFGIINLEAMACKTPVVASRVGGIVEVVDDKVNGFLLPPKDPKAIANAVNGILGSRDLRERLAEAGRDKVEREFSWESIAKKTISLYQDVIKAR